MNRFKMTVLVDGCALDPNLCSEHGFSAWLCVDGMRILFDTGKGNALPENAAALDVDVSGTNAIVLSHGHYDHTGGLLHVFEEGVAAPIYMHPDAVRPRYGYLKTPPHKPIGMRPNIVESLSRRSAAIVETNGPTQVSEHVWVTGPIPRHTPFEDTGGSFFLDAECLAKDGIADDQALWARTAEGIVVILGCAHSGVVNTLDYISELTGVGQFRAVIGGMHLLNASPERLEATVDALSRYHIDILGPCHCTGDSVIPFLAERFPGRYVRVGAGSHFDWPI